MRKYTLLFFIPYFLSGCATTKDNNKTAEGPEETIPYQIQIESTVPARVEINKEYVGKTPLTAKVNGDEDGTFHNFGSYFYVVTATPVNSRKESQTKEYRTGGWFTPEDMIPKRIFFDFGNETASENNKQTPKSIATSPSKKRQHRPSHSSRIKKTRRKG
jgi:hypothetical protein